MRPARGQVNEFPFVEFLPLQIHDIRDRCQIVIEMEKVLFLYKKATNKTPKTVFILFCLPLISVFLLSIYVDIKLKELICNIY